VTLTPEQSYAKAMRIIELDATNWATVLDFYDAIIAAIGGPEGHGHNVNALVDSMIWGGMNAIDPPYIVRIYGVARSSKAIRDEVKMVQQALLQGREYFRAANGRDVEAQLEIAS
jgi:hypothetical protein